MPIKRNEGKQTHLKLSNKIFWKVENSSPTFTMHPKWLRYTRKTAKNCRMESWEDCILLLWFDPVGDSDFSLRLFHFHICFTIFTFVLSSFILSRKVQFHDNTQEGSIEQATNFYTWIWDFPPKESLLSYEFPPKTRYAIKCDISRTHTCRERERERERDGRTSAVVPHAVVKTNISCIERFSNVFTQDSSLSTCRLFNDTSFYIQSKKLQINFLSRYVVCLALH